MNIARFQQIKRHFNAKYSDLSIYRTHLKIAVGEFCKWANENIPDDPQKIVIGAGFLKFRNGRYLINQLKVERCLKDALGGNMIAAEFFYSESVLDLLENALQRRLGVSSLEASASTINSFGLSIDEAANSTQKRMDLETGQEFIGEKLKN